MIATVGLTNQCMACKARVIVGCPVLVYRVGEPGVLLLFFCLGCGKERFGDLTAKAIGRDRAAQLAEEFAKGVE